MLYTLGPKELIAEGLVGSEEQRNTVEETDCAKV